MSSEMFIVTTTIYEPTEATLKFCQMAQENNWRFIIVGDKKTPHSAYQALAAENTSVTYLSPDDQDALMPALSNVTGWNKIQRRNLGFVYAWHLGAKVVATVDDDNIPYNDWGKDLLVGKEVTYDHWTPESGVFDPLSATNHKQIWHRGYPIELLDTRLKVKHEGKKTKKILVQADLWDGDPDIDAMARLIWHPMVKFDTVGPFGSASTAPFNSQNTFLDRSVIPKYAVLPYVGRMDDIWGSYICQAFFPNSVVYNKASVFQDRNVQDLITNLEHEVMGYRHTLEFIRSGMEFEKLLPPEAISFWECYQKQFENKDLRFKIEEHFK